VHGFQEKKRKREKKKENFRESRPYSRSLSPTLPRENPITPAIVFFFFFNILFYHKTMFAALKTSLPVAVLALAAGYGLVAEARPDGSTVCQMTPEIMDRMAKNGAMGPMNPRLAVALSAPAATYTAGGAAMDITVTSGASIQGILMWAENSAGSHVGSITAPAGFKALNIPACKNEGPTSSVTHADPKPKGTTMKFSWTPPKAGQGTLTVKALVVTDKTNGFNMGTARLTGPGTAQNFGTADAGTPSSTAAPSATPKASGMTLSASLAVVAAGVLGTLAANTM
jgi:hypothetical protein